MKLVLQCAMCGTHHPVGTTVCSTCRASGVTQLRLMFECQRCGGLGINPVCEVCPPPLSLDLDDDLVIAEEVAEEPFALDELEGAAAEDEVLSLDLDEEEEEDDFNFELEEDLTPVMGLSGGLDELDFEEEEDEDDDFDSDLIDLEDDELDEDDVEEELDEELVDFNDDEWEDDPDEEDEDEGY